jgi:tRNA (guanine-N(1)-)-methyltransferase
MRFDVLTLFPEIIESYCNVSIMKRAREGDVYSLNTINPRDFTLDKHNKVDDTPYGGGAGMVLMPQPYIDAYDSVEKLENSITIMLSPQGEPLNEKLVLDLSQYEQIIMLCGHYEGFDERIREIIKPKEISLGDFVLTGGELPALCLLDSVSRKLNGTLGKIQSAEDDSFSNGLLEYPQYTKPRDFRGYKVPEVLLNGNHKEINEFRQNQQIERTKLRRPDLYEKWKENN